MPGALLRKAVFVVALPHGHEHAVVIGVKEPVPRAFRSPFVPDAAANGSQESGLVVPVEVDLVGDAVGGVALRAFTDDVRLARDGAERGNPVVVAHELVGDCARFDHARPADQAWHAKGALPVGVLLGAEVRHRAVGPGIHVRAVVARVDDDCVARDAHVVEGLEERADGLIVLDHAIEVLAVAVLVAATVLGADMGAQMHARRVEPAEEGLAGLVLALHVLDGRGGGLVVDRFHPFLGERAVSSMVCLPILPNRGSTVGSSLSIALHLSTPRGPNLRGKPGPSDSREARALPLR